MKRFIVLVLIILTIPTAAIARPEPPHEVAEPIQRHFYSWDWERAADVAWCESRFVVEARNPTSGAAGIFQHMPAFWNNRVYWYQKMWNLPIGPVDQYNIEWNVAIAAQLVYHGGGWRHWNASKFCWG